MSKQQQKKGIKYGNRMNKKGPHLEQLNYNSTLFSIFLLFYFDDFGYVPTEITLYLFILETNICLKLSIDMRWERKFKQVYKSIVFHLVCFV
jgi:cytochrome c oxidase subunit IV